MSAIIEVFKANGRLARNYHPPRFEGDVLLLPATWGERRRRPMSGSPYVGGRIEVHEIDCEHIDMMRPGPLAKIGPVIASALDKQSRTASQKSQDEARSPSQARDARRSQSEAESLNRSIGRPTDRTRHRC